MCYNITSPNASYTWLNKELNLNFFELLSMSHMKSHEEFEKFYGKYCTLIDKIDIENLKIIAIHVTSSNNECADIKKYGLHNLQWVLSNDTDLNRFLKNYNISFDIRNKLMYTGSNIYDIDYEKYCNSDFIFDRNEESHILYKISLRIYNDFRINGFLFCKDVCKYSTICKMPEFLYMLSLLNGETERMAREWEQTYKPYVVKFKSAKNDFMYRTLYYENETDYQNDKQNNYPKLRKKLILNAIKCFLNESVSEIYAFLKPDITIIPNNIIECIPVEEWKKDVFNYFE